MKYSKRQIEVWKAREKLDKKLAGMTPKEVTRYLDGVSDRVKARTGKPLNMRTIDASAARYAEVVK
jgi:hypothetical protein